jgi:lysophospholipase L1-like esterase
MQPFNHRRRLATWLALFLALFAASTATADPIQTYVALGDALAFGQTTTSPQPSYGNQGYVQQLANALGANNNGIVPNVINLALSGETSSSYFTADNSNGARPAGAQANLNYGGDTSLAQRDILAGVLAAEHAAGRVITTVSFALGQGDFLALSKTSAFQSATLSQQESMIDQLIGTLKTNYTTALTQIRGALPDAKILLPSYYNPYGYLGPGDANNVLTGYFVNSQLKLVQSLSQPFNASAVDLATPFVGNELQLTNVASGNPLPNAQGYAAIANQIIAVADAPEPATLSMLVVGGIGVAGWRQVRRRVA